MFNPEFVRGLHRLRDQGESLTSFLLRDNEPQIVALAQDLAARPTSNPVAEADVLEIFALHGIITAMLAHHERQVAN